MWIIISLAYAIKELQIVQIKHELHFQPWIEERCPFYV